MIHYLDTSAWLKRHVEERGSAEVRALFRPEMGVATSRIAHLEAVAALARRAREGNLSKATLQELCRRVDADLETFRVIEVTDDILRKASDLCLGLPLRAYDSVHLSSALRLQEEVDPEVQFVCADRVLARVAEGSGLTCLVPGA